ncbi:TetR/AcrR family transcriptional regulator [Pseudoalteromonas aurantia]|uniref:HTH tetR-type domain-containing protein n=1 Tax=Pseudoalteromonas aurantia 208 TaxID=1314867 RepID=A0ABR9EIV5_9GAMM|nr:TetR/AcrR family transcriptional regulator [Pseudoalteromonas aurantia]MBE0370898.1 hypothetical protein [Pseudoalteromonas aurantia 208]
MGKGKQTKQQILATALNVATATSLNDLTIGGLATITGLSKSGLFGHFNSKENLQLEVLEYAQSIFTDAVIQPTVNMNSAMEKLLTTVECWLNWYRSQGSSCIFVSTSVEFDDQPGAIQDLVKKRLQQWLEYLTQLAQTAANEGQMKGDARQFVFELYSLYLGSQQMVWVGFEDEQHTRFKCALSALIQRYQ